MMMKQAVVGEPLSSVVNEDKTEEKQSIWASILRDVKLSTKKTSVTKSLIVLGDNESGRTTLVAKLQGNDDPKRGSGLEYHYIDVLDDDRDDTYKLGVWILDGHVACSAPLLRFALKSETLESSILILVASMTQPWSLLSTLRKWATLIEEYIDQLKIDPTLLCEMRDRLQYDFQHYTESNDVSSASTTNTNSRVPNSVSSMSVPPANLLTPVNEDEQVVLPLADGVLTKSFGIPIIVVITKCDTMSTLEKENNYKEEHFEFLQYHIRKFCLEYGAALFYTSVKEKKNIDKLYKYIVHKCYGYSFASAAVVTDYDAIFIPAGWDSPKKVDILLENLHHIKSTDNYSDVFIKPANRRPSQRNNEIIVAEDDQEFLSKLQLALNKVLSPGKADEITSPVVARSSSITTGVSSQNPSLMGRGRSQQNNTSNEGALANFFSSLINTKLGSGAAPTNVGTPVTQRQTSQSPTTPSSKRLQQHPLTFSVVQPPGRTRTPTLHKAFPAALNVESSPKSLSPVTEKQSLGENIVGTTSTLVNEHIEENTQVKSLDTQENETPITDAIQNEKALIAEVNQLNDQSLIKQDDAIFNTKDHLNNDNDFSRSQSSFMPAKESTFNDTIQDDKNEQSILSDHASTENAELHTEFLSESDKPSKNTYQSNTSFTEEPVDSSEFIEHKSSQLSPSQDLENTLSLNNPETAEKYSFQTDLNEETKETDTHNSPLNSDEEKLADSKRSLSSEVNLSMLPQQSSSTLNVLQQQEDSSVQSSANITQTPYDDNLSGILSENNIKDNKIHSESCAEQPVLSTGDELSVSSRPASPVKLESSDSVPINQEDNLEYSSDIQQDQNQVSESEFYTNKDEIVTGDQTDVPPSDSEHFYASTNNESQPSTHAAEDNLLESKPFTSRLNDDQNGEQFDHSQNRMASPFTEEQDEEDQSLSAMYQGEIKENVLPSPLFEEVQQKNQSLSSTIQEVEENDLDYQSSVPIVEKKVSFSDNAQLDNAGDDVNTEPEAINRQSLSSAVEEDEQNSALLSPVAQQDDQQDQLNTFATEQTDLRSQSSSAITYQEEPNSPFSSNVQETQQYSQSSSVDFQDSKQRNTSYIEKLNQIEAQSPTTKQDQEQTRLLTFDPHNDEQNLEDVQERKSSQTESSEKNQSPSTDSEQKQQRSPASSPNPVEDELKTTFSSSFPNIEADQQRSSSISPFESELQNNTFPRSPLDDEREQNRTSSDMEKLQGEDLLSAVEPQNDVNQSTFPIDEEESQIIPSTSFNADSEHTISHSLSLASETKGEQDDDRTSPIIHNEEQLSQSPISEIHSQLGQSHESPVQNENEVGNPIISIVENVRPETLTESSEVENLLESTQSSIEHGKSNTNESTSPTTENLKQRYLSSSPIFEDELDNSRSLSVFCEPGSGRSQTPSSLTQEDELKGISQSSMTHEDHKSDRSSTSAEEKLDDLNEWTPREGTTDVNRSSSPINMDFQQRNTSPTDIPTSDQEASHSLLLVSELKDSLSQHLSVNMHDEEQGNTPETLPQDGPQKTSQPTSPSRIIPEQNIAENQSLFSVEKKSEDISSSPTIEQENSLDHSLSNLVEEVQEQSLSPSQMGKSERNMALPSSSVSETDDNYNQTPSSMNHDDEQNASFSSRFVDPNEQRNELTSTTPENIDTVNSSSITETIIDSGGGENDASSTKMQEEEQPEKWSTSQNEENVDIRLVPVKKLVEENTVSSADENVAEQTKSPIIEGLDIDKPVHLSSNFTYEPVHDMEENNVRLEMVQSENEKDDHDEISSSLIREKHGVENENDQQSFIMSSSADESQLHGDNDKKTEDSYRATEFSTNENEQPNQLSSSILVTEESSSNLSPIENCTALTDNNKEENYNSSTPPSPQTIHENNTSTVLHQQDITSVATVEQQPSSFSDSSILAESKPLDTVESTSSKQNAFTDHHVESHASIHDLSLGNHPSTVTRSKSSSSLVRPTTLPFYPNEHDLDGLYLSNEYDDENEIPENNTYHHNSAPSTTTTEYHHSTLENRNDMEQNDAQIDSNNTAHIVSLVENLRMEDNGHGIVDSRNLQDT